MGHVHVNVNTGKSMNSPLSSAALERALAARLRELLGTVDWLGETEVVTSSGSMERGFDLLAKLPLPTGGSAALCVDCKREMRPSTFAMLAKREFKPAGRPKVIVPVLALPWVSPRVAELCLEHGWSWYDLAGNCRIDVPGLLHLSHTGNAPVHERPRPTANLGTKEAGRVVRALLAPGNAARLWTQHYLTNHCQPKVSVGLVNKVVGHLRDEGYLESKKDGGFRVTDPVKLLFVWREAYRFEQHDRQSFFTLLQGAKLKSALHDFGIAAGGRAVFAAFSAAEIQAPNVRQPKTWIYVAADELPRLTEFMEAKPVDSGENLVVLVPADEGVFYGVDGPDTGQKGLGCTNPVQTYVDLWHCGGRGQEAAEALFNQRLKPVWQSAGLNR